MTTKAQIKQAVRSDVKRFLGGEPETWCDPQGRMRHSERAARLRFAEEYTTPKVRDFLADRGLDIGDYIDSDPRRDRADFLRMIMGDWDELEEARHAKKR